MKPADVFQQRQRITTPPTEQLLPAMLQYTRPPLCWSNCCVRCCNYINVTIAAEVITYDVQTFFTVFIDAASVTRCFNMRGHHYAEATVAYDAAITSMSLLRQKLLHTMFKPSSLSLLHLSPTMLQYARLLLMQLLSRMLQPISLSLL